MTSLRDPSNVLSTPVRGRDGTTRGWVRLHVDRANYTEFAIVIDTTSFLAPDEAYGFAEALIAAADELAKLTGES